MMSCVLYDFEPFNDDFLTCLLFDIFLVCHPESVLVRWVAISFFPVYVCICLCIYLYLNIISHVHSTACYKNQLIVQLEDRPEKKVRVQGMLRVQQKFRISI